MLNADAEAATPRPAASVAAANRDCARVGVLIGWISLQGAGARDGGVGAAGAAMLDQPGSSNPHTGFNVS